jgi:hypothetical protein
MENTEPVPPGSGAELRVRLRVNGRRINLAEFHATGRRVRDLPITLDKVL